MSRGALGLDRQCELAGWPAPVAEYRFHLERRWRFDWAFPALLLAIEVEGGAWTGGRHTRGGGFEKDLEKYAEALTLGWRILRVSPSWIRDGRALGYIERILKR